MWNSIFTTNIFTFILQVLIGYQCFERIAYLLDYGGHFLCKPVQYMTGGIIGGVLLVIVVVIACYRRRKGLAEKLLPIRSVYPGYIPSIYRDMPEPRVRIIADWITIAKSTDSFTPVCQSFCSQGVVVVACVTGGVHGRGGGMHGMADGVCVG